MPKGPKGLGTSIVNALAQQLDAHVDIASDLNGPVTLTSLRVPTTNPEAVPQTCRLRCENPCGRFLSYRPQLHGHCVGNSNRLGLEQLKCDLLS
jgi:hypothetical protein